MQNVEKSEIVLIPVFNQFRKCLGGKCGNKF